jgi:hypothetical protein
VTALQSGTTRLVDAEVGFASAVTNATSSGLGTPQLNEYNNQFSCPPLKDDPKTCAPSPVSKHSYARGSSLEAGLGTTVPSGADPNQLILAAEAQASAPKSSHDDQQIGPVPADPLAYASVTRGNAVANWNSSGLVPGVCTVGDDISRGFGYAADAQLLDAGTANKDGSMGAPVVATDATSEDNVLSTTTHQTLVPTKGIANNFGLQSSVVETLAPVTILKSGNTSAITIKVLGQWRLAVTANGHPGGASVTYAPVGDVSNSTPVVQLFNGPLSGTPAGELTLQQLLGNTGAQIGIPGVVTVTAGEAPRAIAKPDASPVFGSKPHIAADGTSVSAAVDVVRVELLGGAAGLGTITIGHMEASAQVPSGGINCPIPVTKEVNPDKIHIGAQPDTARVTFNVLNPFNCDLADVVLTDSIRQKVGDPDFVLLTSNPAASSPSMPTSPLHTADVTWNLGTVKAGQHVVVTMDVKSNKSGGILRDVATANGKLANCTGAAVAGISLNNLAMSGISPVVDINIELARTGPNSRATVAEGVAIAAIAAAAAFTLRRRRRA